MKWRVILEPESREQVIGLSGVPELPGLYPMWLEGGREAIEWPSSALNSVLILDSVCRNVDWMSGRIRRDDSERSQKTF